MEQNRFYTVDNEAFRYADIKANSIEKLEESTGKFIMFSIAPLAEDTEYTTVVLLDNNLPPLIFGTHVYIRAI